MSIVSIVTPVMFTVTHVMTTVTPVLFDHTCQLSHLRARQWF